MPSILMAALVICITAGFPHHLPNNFTNNSGYTDQKVILTLENRL
jgi:hypothetical protein